MGRGRPESARPGRTQLRAGFSLGLGRGAGSSSSLSGRSQIPSRGTKGVAANGPGVCGTAAGPSLLALALAPAAFSERSCPLGKKSASRQRAQQLGLTEHRITKPPPARVPAAPPRHGTVPEDAGSRWVSPPLWRQAAGGGCGFAEEKPRSLGSLKPPSSRGLPAPALPSEPLPTLRDLQTILLKFNKSRQMHSEAEEGPRIVYVSQPPASYPHARGAGTLVSVRTLRLHIHTGKHKVAQRW